jgi:hypothetical protein
MSGWDDGSACIDGDGNEWPDHTFGVFECKRCGAEAADYRDEDEDE